MPLALPLALAACATFDLSRFRAPKSDGTVVAAAPGTTCFDLAPENQLHPLRACETPTAYEVTAGEERWRFAGPAFRRALREQLFAFAHASEYHWRTLAGAEVEVWLVAPLFAPEEASFVAVVLGPGGNFAVRLPLQPESWRIAAEDVAWLGSDTYPSPGAEQVGKVVVQGKDVGGPDRLAQLIASSGVLGVRSAVDEPLVRRVVPAGDAALVELETEPFAEGAVTRRLLAAPRARRLIERVGRLPAKDPVGYKARVFRFPFSDLP